MRSSGVLLDSHALVWLLDKQKSKSIGKSARRIIENADIVYVSSVSFVELRLKEMIGKLTLMPNFRQAATDAGMVLLDFTSDHADAVLEFPALARHDAFDRMLLASAHAEGLTFLTADTLLLDMGLDFVQDVSE